VTRISESRKLKNPFSLFFREEGMISLKRTKSGDGNAPGFIKITFHLKRQVLPYGRKQDPIEGGKTFE